MALKAVKVKSYITHQVELSDVITEQLKDQIKILTILTAM
jgi:hypothetical protein